MRQDARPTPHYAGDMPMAMSRDEYDRVVRFLILCALRRRDNTTSDVSKMGVQLRHDGDDPQRLRVAVKRVIHDAERSEQEVFDRLCRNRREKNFPARLFQ